MKEQSHSRVSIAFTETSSSLQTPRRLQEMCHELLQPKKCPSSTKGEGDENSGDEQNHLNMNANERGDSSSGFTDNTQKQDIRPLGFVLTTASQPHQGLFQELNLNFMAKKKEGISEVIQIAEETVQEGEEKDELEEESYSTEQVVTKWQMKRNADNCQVNHRQKIHLTSRHKMKGSELITAFRKKLLGLSQRAIGKYQPQAQKSKQILEMIWNGTKQTQKYH